MRLEFFEKIAFDIPQPGGSIPTKGEDLATIGAKYGC
jgi:hypothetical protein